MLFQKRIIHSELDIYFYITVFLCLLNALVHRTHPLSSPKNLGEILVPIYRTQGDYHWGDISVCGLLVPKRIIRPVVSVPVVSFPVVRVPVVSVPVSVSQSSVFQSSVFQSSVFQLSVSQSSVFQSSVFQSSVFHTDQFY
jgi:hypothetical protein